MANGWKEPQLSGRFAGLLAAGGGIVAVGSLLLAGAAGEPYLEAAGVNGWLVVFAAVVLAIAFVAGFDTGTLAGAAGLIAAIEAGLVLATIVVWLLSG